MKKKRRGEERSSSLRKRGAGGDLSLKTKSTNISLNKGPL